MEREPKPEQFNPHAIERLPQTLGFTETQELSQLRGQLVEAIAVDSEKIRELATQYHLLAEQVINQHQGENFVKAQIGLIVAMGLIQREGDRIDDYVEQLKDALTYADNMGFKDIVDILIKTIASTEKPTSN